MYSIKVYRNIGMQGVQEFFFVNPKAPGSSRTQGTLNSYDKVNPTSFTLNAVICS